MSLAILMARSSLNALITVGAFSVKYAALIRAFLFASFRIYCVVQIDVHGDTLVRMYSCMGTCKYMYTHIHKQTSTYTSRRYYRVPVGLPTGAGRFYFRKIQFENTLVQHI